MPQDNVGSQSEAPPSHSTRQGRHARRNAIVAKYLMPIISSQDKRVELAFFANVSTEAVNQLAQFRLIKEQELTDIIENAGRYLASDMIQNMQTELARLDLTDTTDKQDQSQSKEDQIHQPQKATINKAWENPSQNHDEVPAPIENPPTQEQLHQELREAVDRVYNQQDNQELVSVQPTRPSNRGDHARRVATVARYLQPILSDPMIVNEFAAEANIPSEVIHQLLRKRLIKQDDLLMILRHSLYWLPLHEYLRMLYELAEGDRGKPFGDRHNDSELYEELRNEANKAYRGESHADQVPENEQDGPSLIDWASLTPAEPLGEDADIFDFDQESGTISLEVGAIRQDRFAAVSQVIEHVISYGGGTLDFLNVRLSHDGQFDIECGNIVPPANG